VTGRTIPNPLNEVKNMGKQINSFENINAKTLGAPQGFLLG